MGLARLETMRQKLISKRASSGVWDLENVTSRFGPSIVTKHQQFMCNYPKTCNLDIRGEYLNNRDQVHVFPTSHACGNPLTNPWDLPVQYPKTKPQPHGNLTLLAYHLGNVRKPVGREAVDFRLCYCEYGHCDSTQRFSQDVGT